MFFRQLKKKESRTRALCASIAPMSPIHSATAAVVAEPLQMSVERGKRGNCQKIVNVIANGIAIEYLRGQLLLVRRPDECMIKTNL